MRCLRRLVLLLGASAIACGLVAASCVQSPETETSAFLAPNDDGPEPVGVAQQEAKGPLFKPVEFIFVIEREWDGEDQAGGWQIAYNTSAYATQVNGEEIYTWRCQMKVGMPRHTVKMGDIPTSRAADMTAEIANLVTWPLLKKEEPWTGRGAAFCIAQRAGMQAMFRARYPYLGATVQPRD
jgi:hypothetical protein